MSHLASSAAPPSLSFLTSIFNAFADVADISAPTRPELPGERNPSMVPLPRENQTHGSLHTLSPPDTDKARALFLTLHMLFPHELLPALDLLDRGLVTRLMNKPPGLDTEDQSKAGNEEAARPEMTAHESSRHQSLSRTREEVPGVFYVLSSSAAERSLSASRYRPRHGNTTAAATFYEVRLDSWNCSCPAFAVSCFQRLGLSDADASSRHVQEDSPNEEQSWRFGGSATRHDFPIPSCKHILAAVLMQVAPDLLGHGVLATIASKEQLAAWGGGWGEFSGG